MTESLLISTEQRLDASHEEGLDGNVKLTGSLVCSDCEIMEFEILRAAKRAHGKFTTLEFRRADFGLLRDLLVEYHGIKPWRGFPGEKRGPRKLISIQESPHPSSEMMHPNEEEVREKCQKTCRCDQGAPGQM